MIRFLFLVPVYLALDYAPIFLAGIQSDAEYWILSDLFRQCMEPVLLLMCLAGLSMFQDVATKAPERGLQRPFWATSITLVALLLHSLIDVFEGLLSYWDYLGYGLGLQSCIFHYSELWGICTALLTICWYFFIRKNA